ncbi:hypothetical protein K7X08_032957 [Anisodus acutangulus]|uniref:Pectinesterase inhibitor domain-containing protein n=1 Tax=Anisodus acutangulus TaxID=402998 RepID=A0A9Q1M0N3_9SOLA|nr:hypothetical protein K7X08_032950 [Anisodus acutangulus]KAJ8549247.1 hypothetical protein K7X08_032954 [Anisodus acutangulus]KAJ8549248.1 hypothetical protein K7X08_032955 [Anisodus acutangulus]KAJ8549249.1 hypothetical protein K7X08_032956 [Anisodus acutangulus]KAJ8549250.1 hypothetical protein K7X08_032957 [Anisodus acutangulus]
MANRNGVAFSLVSLALTFLLFASQSNAQQTVDPAIKVSPYCVKAIDKPFCTKIVKVADTWQEAITEVLSKTIMQTKMAEPIMANLLITLPSTTDAKLKDDIGSGCRKSYNDALQTLKEVEESLKTGDKTQSANTKISAAMTRLDDCEDEFKKIPMPTEFATFYEGSKKLLSTCLAVERTRPDLV